MNTLKNRTSKYQRGFFYSLLALFAVILSLVLSYSNLKNFNWENIFEKTQISDVPINSQDFDMCVHFLDVGKADCAYIRCGDKNILIDAGDKEPTDIITEYLKRQKVTKLDLVVVSHPHRDHIGQLSTVLNEFKVDKIIEGEIPKEIIPTSVTYEKLLKTILDKNVTVQTVHAGDTLEIGKMKIEIFGPVCAEESVNNNSVVMKITYGSVSFLFAGDAEKREETSIINSGKNLGSTVLKVGHHGSNTSSTYKFLKEVSPNYAVISVAHDRSDLPKDKVIQRIKGFCSEIYRTDENGTIVFLTNGNEIKVETEK